MTPARYEVGKKFFFRSVPLLLSKIKISIFKKNAHRLGNWKLTIFTGYCDVERLTVKANTIRPEKRCVQCSITALSPNISSIVYKYLVACLVVERHHEALINP